MSFYTGLHGATITPEGKAYITPLSEQDFNDSRLWTPLPLTNFIDLPLKFTCSRKITDRIEKSVREEVNEYATRVRLDVSSSASVFGQPPPCPLHGNITFVRVDGGPLHPFVLKYIVDLTKVLVDGAKKRIAEARTRGDKEEERVMGWFSFRGELFHEGFEITRSKELEKQEDEKNLEWEVGENPFRPRVL